VSVCDDVDLVLAAGAVSGGVSPEELQQVRTHTATCARCATAAAEYMATADALVLAVEPAEPSRELRTRLMAEVYASLPATTRAPAAARAPSGMGRWLAGLWRRVPSGRGLTVGGALAAAAAVGLLAWTVGPGRAGGPAPQTAAIRGTLADEAAHGSLTYYPQTRTAVLSVTGLRNPADGVYEVWLVRPSNAVSPAGFLTRQPDGTWSVALQGGLQGYSAVAATVEPPGGSAAPTGQEVLAGPVPGG
jgi:anti-sigma-K factor RskA